MNSSKDKLVWLQGVIIFLIAVIQYANTANHDYAWDDAIVLTENSRVQKGLSNIPELFENIKSERTENRYGYRPIALLSFATDVELFGMNPEPAHKVNILLYGLLCALLFYFINALFGPQFGSWAVFAVTALFVVHPLHTEVVANIKSRDEILALMFGVSSLLTFRSALLGKPLYYLISCMLMVLAFNSKESAITLCGMLFVMPLFVGKVKVSNWRTWLFGIGLASLFLVVLLGVRQYVYSDQFFQTNDFDLIDKGVFLQDGYVGNPLWDADLQIRIANAFYLSAYAVYRFFVPYPLLHDYSINVFPVRTWADVEVFAAFGFVILLVFLMLHGLWKRKAHGFGLSVFFVSHSIYLHVVHVGPDIFAERYLFVPSLGICIAFLSLFELVRNRKVVLVIIALACLPMFGYSWKRNAAWKNNETLLKTDLPRLENCARANYNYALYLHDKYYGLPANQQSEAQKKILKHYEIALSQTDRIFKVYMDLGSAYMEFGYPQKGYNVFVEASLKYPILSGPYVQLGKFFMSYSKYEEAVPYFDDAIRYGNTNSDYYYLKGLCQFQYGDFSSALTTLDDGKRHGIMQAEYYVLMTTVLIRLDERERAEEILNEGMEAFPQAKRLQEIRNGFFTEKSSG